jgi:hypothetical protein
MQLSLGHVEEERRIRKGLCWHVVLVDSFGPSRQPWAVFRLAVQVRPRMRLVLCNLHHQFLTSRSWTLSELG